ncbi:anti-sigma-K factor RskA [Kribbella orskensis]|uniref:Regulator of SigK n=1 Tax=Kribbella orskensis TaxID=2512216 RepID=A0ABY2B8R2_9ACTN|nr:MULTISPECIES: anti-sigma factor [Kribbella]TCN31074.1 anti-sigma-K factor RskA [Kribbella sp. VKM Ac-2500]TCO11609.1 anti-sigma-K factor RskA [Kribbella orskensis]
MTTPEVHALTGPYVLNALPEDERVGFEAHLADCRSCSAEVAELREAANKLGTAVATEPPPALKARVLAEIATTRQLHPLVKPDGPATQQPTPVKKGFNRRSFFGLAAAGLAVAGAGGIAIDQYRDNSRTKLQNEELAALLAESDAQTVRGDVKGGGSATVVMSPSKDRAIVLLQGLQKLPDGKLYQLWLMDKSRTLHSAGLASGKASDQSKLIQGGVADKIAFGLTVENSPGATTPTLPPAALIAMA